MTDVEQRNDPVPGRYIIFGLMVVLALLILEALLLFKGNWLVSLKLDKGQASFWDAAFKAIGGIVADAGIAITVSNPDDPLAGSASIAASATSHSSRRGQAP
jgi:hypothetical protein